jgi:hypothetical protein
MLDAVSIGFSAMGVNLREGPLSAGFGPNSQ